MLSSLAHDVKWCWLPLWPLQTFRTTVSGADLPKRSKNKLVDLETHWTGFDRLLSVRLGFYVFVFA